MKATIILTALIVAGFFMGPTQCQPHTPTYQTEEEAKSLREYKEKREGWLRALKSAGIEPLSVEYNVWIGSGSDMCLSNVNWFAREEEIWLIVYYSKPPLNHREFHDKLRPKLDEHLHVHLHLAPYGQVIDEDYNILVLHDQGLDSARVAAEQLVIPHGNDLEPDGIGEWPSPDGRER